MPGTYVRRIVDDEIDVLLPGLPALALEGAKGVGKTATARRRAATAYRLDDRRERQIIEADLSRLTGGTRPILIDEWQRVPESWDVVRRAVDDGAPPGTFLLTGSPPAPGTTTHSGAGRIVIARMRPLSLAERGRGDPTVSLGELLNGGLPPLRGATQTALVDYVEEIVRSGFPGLRHLADRALRAQLDGYVDRIVDREFPEAGHVVRNPAGLRRWLTAYAAASATNATYEAIRDAAAGGSAQKPSRASTIPYRDVLERLHVVDPLPAWLPTRNRMARLGAAPKHHLVDPALAAPIGIGSAAAGDRGGVIVYRKDGPVELPVSVERLVNIRTGDIYLQGKYIRPGYELNLDIQAGDSGAVVVIGGKAVALVWATSRETKARAWAMQASLLADHLSGDTAVDHGDCA